MGEAMGMPGAANDRSDAFIEGSCNKGLLAIAAMARYRHLLANRGVQM